MPRKLAPIGALAAILSACFAPTAYAGAYYLLDVSAEQAVLFDEDSLVEAAQSRVAWIAFVYAKDRYDPAHHPYRIALTQIEFDCAQMRDRPIAMASYDAAGAQVNQSEVTAEVWADPAPDTNGEQMLRLACGLIEPPGPAVRADLPNLRAKLVGMMAHGDFQR